MKFIYGILICFFIIHSCSYKNLAISGNKLKNTPCSLIEPLDSLVIKLDINIDKNNIITAKTSITNRYQDSFLLYKKLLPDSILQEKVFHLFVTKLYSEVNYLGKRNSNFLCNDSNMLKLSNKELNENDFILIRPNDILNFKVEVNKFYDLNEQYGKGNKNYMITYAVFMPKIKNGEQVFKKDSIDQKLKPVYYMLSVTGKNIDEKRISFTLF